MDKADILEQKIFDKIKYYLNKRDIKKFKYYESRLKAFRYAAVYDDYGGSKAYYKNEYNSLTKLKNNIPK